MAVLARYTRSAPLARQGTGLRKGEHAARPASDAAQVIDQAVALINERAVEGLNEAVEWTAERARYHAPVRSAFNDVSKTGAPVHSRGGAKTEFPRGEKNASGRRNYIRTTEQWKLFQKSRRRDKRFQGVDTYRVGKANSANPIFRVGNTRLGVEGLAAERDNPRQLAYGPFQDEKGARLTTLTLETTSTKTPQFTISGGKFLSTRGRYDLSRGRGLATSAVGGVQHGGTLRNSIKPILASVTNRSSVWGYVVTDVPYAKYQEFGTSRNKAHPFLRPALYEARKMLPKLVRASIARTSSRFTLTGTGRGKVYDVGTGSGTSLGTSEQAHGVFTGNL